MHAIIGYLAWSALASTPPAADPPASWLDRFEWRGILESEAAIQTGDGRLQKWDFAFEPEATADLGGLGRLTLIGRLRLDPADELEPGRPELSNDFRSPASRRLLIGDVGGLELRELYLDRYIGPVFLRAGKQQIVWGQADGLRVLDIVNPFHFREFILPEFEDRRIPLWTLQAEAPIGPLSAQFIWIPDHTYDDIPEQGAAFAFTSPRFVPRPPPGVVGTGPVILEEPNRPGRFILDDDYGLRLTTFQGGWDLSLNYLYHYQDQPALRQQRRAGGGLLIRRQYERTHLVGGAFSNAFGDFTLRGEAAYSSERFFLTNAPADPDGVFQTGEFGHVVGLDYQYDADLLLSGQFFQSILTNRPEGATRDRADNQLTFLARREFRNDTITASVLVIHGLNDGDGVVQADLDYAWRANIILKLGADIFYGDSEGLFGQFESADRVTLGIEVGF